MCQCSALRKVSNGVRGVDFSENHYRKTHGIWNALSKTHVFLIGRFRFCCKTRAFWSVENRTWPPQNVTWPASEPAQPGRFPRNRQPDSPSLSTSQPASPASQPAQPGQPASPHHAFPSSRYMHSWPAGTIFWDLGAHPWAPGAPNRELRHTKRGRKTLP